MRKALITTITQVLKVKPRQHLKHNTAKRNGFGVLIGAVKPIRWKRQSNPRRERYPRTIFRSISPGSENRFSCRQESFQVKVYPFPPTTANVSQSIRSQSDRNCARVDILSPVINCEGEKKTNEQIDTTLPYKARQISIRNGLTFLTFRIIVLNRKRKKNAKNSSLLQMDWIRTKITSGGLLDWAAKVYEESEKEKRSIQSEELIKCFVPSSIKSRAIRSCKSRLRLPFTASFSLSRPSDAMNLHSEAIERHNV